MGVIKIPPVLRAAVGGEREVRVEGETVADVLEALYTLHPDVRSQLASQDGELHRFVNLYLNDEDVRMLGWLETPVAENDTLTILPAMAGGAPVLHPRSSLMIWRVKSPTGTDAACAHIGVSGCRRGHGSRGGGPRPNEQNPAELCSRQIARTLLGWST